MITHSDFSLVISSQSEIFKVLSEINFKVDTDKRPRLAKKNVQKKECAKSQVNANN